MTTRVDGEVILQFRRGELVRVMPVAQTDEESTALLKQVEQAAALGDLTRIRGDD